VTPRLVYFVRIQATKAKSKKQIQRLVMESLLDCFRAL